MPVIWVNSQDLWYYLKGLRQRGGKVVTNADVMAISRNAGLRSFVPDRTPVIGMDEDAQSFFWLAGQGGYGIQTAPTIARAAAALITTGALPDDLIANGLRKSDLAPQRLR